MSWEDVESWTAPDGGRLALRRLDPASAPRGAVIIVHGWGEHAGRYAHVAAWFAECGLAAWALDQRGHGRSSGRRGDIARFAQFLADVVALRKRVQAATPGPQLLLGHSNGGLIVLRYLQTAPEALAGAIVTSPFLDVGFPVPRVKEAFARFAVHLVPSLRIPTGLVLAHLSTDPAVVEAARTDPYCHQVMTPRAWHEIRAAQRDARAEAPRIDTALFMGLAAEDRIASTPASTAFAAALTGNVTTRTYDGMYHEILNERERDRVFADLGAWTYRILGAREAA